MFLVNPCVRSSQAAPTEPIASSPSEYVPFANPPVHHVAGAVAVVTRGSPKTSLPEKLMKIGLVDPRHAMLKFAWHSKVH